VHIAAGREIETDRERESVSLGSAILRLFFFPLLSPEKERRRFVDPRSGGEIERRTDKVSERVKPTSNRASTRRSFRDVVVIVIIIVVVVIVVVVVVVVVVVRSLSRAMDRDSRSYSCGGCERTAAEGRAMPME